MSESMEKRIQCLREHTEPCPEHGAGPNEFPGCMWCQLEEYAAIRAELKAENQRLRETEKRLMEHVDAKTGDCVQDDQWDDVWHLAHPDDSSWEYPGQVIREVRHKFTELEAENQRLREAVDLLRRASYQSHTGHWDATQQHGAGCPECIRARELRDKADAIMNR